MTHFCQTHICVGSFSISIPSIQVQTGECKEWYHLSFHRMDCFSSLKEWIKRQMNTPLIQSTQKQISPSLMPFNLSSISQLYSLPTYCNIAIKKIQWFHLFFDLNGPFLNTFFSFGNLTRRVWGMACEICCWFNSYSIRFGYVNLSRIPTFLSSIVLLVACTIGYVIAKRKNNQLLRKQIIDAQGSFINFRIFWIFHF